jgi:hypothetical protein
MVKIIDMDSIFDNYISDFVYKNVGKLKPEEIEDQMPVLYEKFGNEKLSELDGKTPNEYYRQFTVSAISHLYHSHHCHRQDLSYGNFYII